MILICQSDRWKLFIRKAASFSCSIFDMTFYPSWDFNFRWIMPFANRVNRILLDLSFWPGFCILVLWLICNVPVMKPISVYDLINLHSERFLKRWTKASTTHQNLSNWKCHKTKNRNTLYRVYQPEIYVITLLYYLK